MLPILLQKKTIDINNDCLERIFKYFEFRDLTNLAEANKNLKITAEMAFKYKLKSRMIIVHPSYGLSSDIDIYDNALCIRIPLLAAKIIRLFGNIFKNPSRTSS